jgi:hypothetical protein
LNIGEYEQFKDAAFDPYVAMREFYTRARRKKVENRVCRKCEAKVDNDEIIRGKADRTLPAKTREFVAQGHTGHYYVQIGAFFDRDSMNEPNLKLGAMGEKTIVATYRRGDYTFYALQVPAGSNIEDAKRVELKLMLAGFRQTRVLRRG